MYDMSMMMLGKIHVTIGNWEEEDLVDLTLSFCDG